MYFLVSPQNQDDPPYILSYYQSDQDQNLVCDIPRESYNPSLFNYIDDKFKDIIL